jgi:NAD(P)-dependent dehydrogenase (short-subunit alcohol dehydrogenase family)
VEIRLDKKRAVVTGANSGIGETIALELAAAGARVCVNYVVHPETAEQVVARIKGAGGDAFAQAADVSDAALDRAWGGVDVLVNNAGVDGPRALGWEYALDAWHSVVAINLAGAYACAREALRRMIPQRDGVVINVTSVHEFIPWTGYTAYTASKAGLSMLTKTLAQEAAPHGVRVVSIAPGAIQTPINADVWENPATRADLMSKIPMGRMGRPDEVAKMAVVLASDVAGYVTGSTVLVDGGMTLYPSFMHGG